MAYIPIKTRPAHAVLGLLILAVTGYFLLAQNSRGGFGDLVAGLDDPRLKVRIDSAHALGESGDQRAVEPLLRQLEKDRANIYSLAEALGKLKSKQAVLPLLNKLYNHYGETDEIVAWALGEIGDRRALPALKEAEAKIKKPQTVKEKRAKYALADAIHKLEIISLQQQQQ